MSFWSAISQLRTILTGETDYDSPNSEELNEQIRENIEVLFMLLFDTGDSGSATSDPPDDATGVLTDTGAAYGVDEHNTRTLFIMSGSAIGNLYTIDDTIATALTCTGDNLYADGVRSGDTYKVLYDVKVNADGHDHDGINSKSAVLADGVIIQAKIHSRAVGQVELKSTTGTVNSDNAAWVNLTLPGGEYGFYPRIKSEHASATGQARIVEASFNTTSYVTNISLIRGGSGGLGGITVLQRYIEASGEVYWVFILRDKITKIVLSMWQSSDHPCFGNGGKPKLCPHPFGSYDPAIHEIVVINPSKKDVLEMRKATVVEADDQPDRDLLEVIAVDYEIDEGSNPEWPDVPVTVGLPPDWSEAWLERRKVTPIKKIIPQPEGVLVKSLKKISKEL